jgi:hypothetical protein
MEEQDSDQPPDPTAQAGRALTVAKHGGGRPRVTGSADVAVPAIIADAGEHATRRFLEFFATTIRNRNTWIAYLHAVGRFFAWCEPAGEHPTALTVGRRAIAR